MSKAGMFLATRADAARRGDHGVVRAMDAELSRLGVPINSGEGNNMSVKNEIAELLGQAQAKVGQLDAPEHDRGRVVAGIQSASGALSTIEDAPAEQPAPPLPRETPEGPPQTETPEQPAPAPAEGDAPAEPAGETGDAQSAAADAGAGEEKAPAAKRTAAKKKSAGHRRAAGKG